MSRKAVCFHRSVTENQWFLNGALRTVDLEDRTLGLPPGKPGFKPVAAVSQGTPNLKMGQAYSDPLAEPATVYREGCDFAPQCQVSHSPWYVWSTMARAFLWDEVCRQFWSVSWGGFWFCSVAFFLYKLLCKLTLEQDFYVAFHASVQFQWWEESFSLSLSDMKAFLFELSYRGELLCVEHGDTWYVFLALSGNLLLLPSCPVLLVKLLEHHALCCTWNSLHSSIYAVAAGPWV